MNTVKADVTNLLDEVNEEVEHTLKERLSTHMVKLYDNEKYPRDGEPVNPKPTGVAMLSNEVENLAVIDIDISKEIDEDDRAEIREQLLKRVKEHADVIVKTTSGGLHVYANTDNCANVYKNRMVKCFEGLGYEVDLFTSVEPNSRSIVVLPGTTAKNHLGELGKYKFIKGDWSTIITTPLVEVLAALGIELPEPVKPVTKDESDDDDKDDMSDELFEAVLNGFDGLTIHRDAQPIGKEITLYTLLRAINALPKDKAKRMLRQVEDKCELTAAAQGEWLKAQARYEGQTLHPNTLIKMLRIHNHDYYAENVAPLLKDGVTIHKIDLQDGFYMKDIREKNEKGLYKHDSELIEDLSRVIRFIDDENGYFLQKAFDTAANAMMIKAVKKTDMTGTLRMIKLRKEGKKQITAYDVLLNYLSKFTFKGVRFNPNGSDVFSLFYGFKYTPRYECNMNVVSGYLDLIREVIADGNKELSEYILNWIAYIIQNPGKKTETALVLKGLQGIGKGTFTDVLSELMARYSCANVTNIEELTGEFNSVLEGKMLLVLNELKNVGDGRQANFDALKSLITDKTFRVNEKNQPRRTAENVGNFILISNHAYVVTLEGDDRRYVVTRVNAKRKNDLKYWKDLHDSFTPDFYENLMTYFLKRDLTGFNPRSIPMTEAKRELIEASRPPFEMWICNHYDELCDGLPCEEARVSRPPEVKEKIFQFQLKDKCDHKQKRVDRKRVWCYFLKDECKEIYSQTHIDADEIDEEAM